MAEGSGGRGERGGLTQNPLDPNETRLAALEHALARVAARVGALEAASGLTPAPASPAPADTAEPWVEAVPAGVRPAPAEVLPVADSGPGLLALSGQTVLALAGAYLIRALTDAGIVSPIGGVALGLAYALLFTLLADRAAAGGQLLRADFHALASVLIAYPLLWETSTRLGILAPSGALAALVGVFAAGAAVATRHRLWLLLWTGICVAVATAAALLVATQELLPAILALLTIATLVEAIALHGSWPGLRFVPALALDAAVLVLAWLAGRPSGLPEGYPPIHPVAAAAGALALPAVYLVSIATRTLRLDRAVGTFDVLQGSAALAIGFLGAERIWAANGGSGLALGLLGSLLGLLGYAVAFVYVERRTGQATNFYFYSTAGGVLVLLESSLLLGAGGRALAWSALGLAGVWLGRGLDRMTLRAHGVVFLCAAVVSSGAVGTATRDLLGPPRVELLEVFGWLSAAAALACYRVLAADRAVNGWKRVPHAVAAALSAWLVAGILVAEAAQLLSLATQPAALATLRSGAIAVLAVGLAAAGRRYGLVELGWLVYPLLALGGLKLLAEDLPAGRAAALFLSFVVYGAALIAAPRLLRRSG